VQRWRPRGVRGRALEGRARECLSGVFMGHLRRYLQEEKDDATDDNSWERVHVTVALMGDSAALDRCTYDVQFLYAEGEVETELPIGRVLEASSANVRGVWAQCKLELPAMEVEDVRVLVRVSPQQSSEEKCVLQPADSVLVFFNANTALYECAADAFLPEGRLCKKSIGHEDNALRVGRLENNLNGWMSQTCILREAHP
jgi:hypothetical protein